MTSRITVLMPLVVLVLAMMGCTGGEATIRSPRSEQEYDVRGNVLAMNSAKATVTLDHEEIPGLMNAMQMEFHLNDPRLLEGLAVGDKVEGRLKKGESGYVVTQLRKRTGS